MGKCSPILARELINAMTALSLRQRPRRATWAFIALVLFAAWGARAQDYPNRPVRLMTDSAPGSAIDVPVRLIAEGLSRIWGQQAVVVNQPGAGGAIAVGTPPISS